MPSVTNRCVAADGNQILMRTSKGRGGSSSSRLLRSVLSWTSGAKMRPGRPRKSVMAHLEMHGRRGVVADPLRKSAYRPRAPQPIRPQEGTCPRRTGAAGVLGGAERSPREKLPNGRRRAVRPPSRWANREVRNDDDGADAVVHAHRLAPRPDRKVAGLARTPPERQTTEIQTTRAARRDPRILSAPRAVRDRPARRGARGPEPIVLREGGEAEAEGVLVIRTRPNDSSR